MLPIVASLGAFLMVFGLRYLQNKENMSMIERGINPNVKNRRLNSSQTLKNGLMFTGAGLGLLLALVLNETVFINASRTTQTGTFFALIALFGGIGLLSAYFYERKNPPPTYPDL